MSNVSQQRNQSMKTTQLAAVSVFIAGLTPFAATTQAASLEVDFQATIASEQHPDYPGEAQYYHVSVNPANPGTGSYAATVVGTNDPAPAFVRNFDGLVVAYKFAGGTNNDITAVAQEGGSLGGGIITFATTDTSFDGFGQQQAKIWTSTDPGPDIEAVAPDPYNVTDDVGSTGGWRGLGGATGTIDISALTAGSVHIYYGAFGAKPTLSVVMRDTDGAEPDITIAEAHLNGDTANRTEYYLAEIDFVNDAGYDEIEFTWDSDGDGDLATGGGRGLAVVVTDFVADAIDPTLAPANITDDSGGAIASDGTPLIYTVTYSEFMDPATIASDDFELIGTASGTIESVSHFGAVTTINVLPTLGITGTMQLQVKAGAVIADLAANELDTTSAITDDTIITINADTVAPEVTSFESPSVSGTIYGTPTITYTVTFSEFVGVLDASNFTNTGTAPFAIGAVTDISPGAPSPSVYTVEVAPSGSGTVQLTIQGLIEDGSGNELVVPATDVKVFTLDTGTEPARETVTLDDSATSNATSPTHTLTFDASASDKLVVIVTGENGNPGAINGNCTGITYDGVALTQAVNRDPVGSAPSAQFDQLYNDIWYLDDPAAATALEDENDPDPLTPGNIIASVNSRGVITVVRLSGTAPGVGATVVSDQEVKSATLLAATSGGMVLASHGMGGDSNSADTQNVNTDPLEAELSAVKQGSSWDGHVTSATSAASPGYITATFTGGNTVGSHTIAAEFLGAEVATGGFSAWQSLNGASGTFDDDHDNDRVQDGIEFFIGGETGNTTGFTTLPSVVDSGSTLSITWTKAADYDGVYGTHYWVETSDTLSGWVMEPTPGNVEISGNDITYTFPAGTKRFVRLNVSGP